MKKALAIFSILILIGCGSKSKISEAKPLFEILTRQEDGGASIRFFEILSEEREIKMLQNDALLKNKITGSDINNANFIILNMGEKNTLGYTIDIENIEETADKIIIKVRDIEPKKPGAVENEVFYYPYTIVKVNSKKPITIQ